MPPANQPSANQGPIPPASYPGVQPPQPPAPAPDPNAAPAWATGLISAVDQVRQTQTELTQRLDELGGEYVDPGAGAGGAGNQPPAGGTPAPGTPNPNDPYSGWKPKDWEDVPRTAQQIARTEVEQALSARDQAANDANERAARARQDADRALDTKVRDLETQGVIPKVVNAQDPNDPGRTAQRELYSRALYENTDDLVRVAQDIKFHHERGFTWDPQNSRWLETNRPPAGMYAPVGGASGPGAMPGQAGAQKPTYAQIHSARSLSALAARAGMQ